MSIKEITQYIQFVTGHKNWIEK